MVGVVVRHNFYRDTPQYQEAVRRRERRERVGRVLWALTVSLMGYALFEAVVSGWPWARELLCK